MRNDIIFLEGLEFYAFHGVPDAERETGRRYRLDIRMTADLRAAAVTDRVQETINYGEAALLALETAREPRRRLLETIAEAIAQTLLERYAMAQEVEVTLRKLHPPIPAVIEAAGVTIVRRRGFSSPQHSGVSS